MGRQRGGRTGIPKGGGAPDTVGRSGGPTPDVPQYGFVRDGGGAAASTEEGAGLQVCGYVPQHNYGTHLTGGVPDDYV